MGKSSLLNSLTEQDISLVSAVAGTTTDPVEKAMELLPFGPVLFIDTGGIDDTGEVGELRVRRTEKVLERTDIAIVVIEPDHWGEYEERIAAGLADKKIPFLVAVNKIDIIGCKTINSPCK